MDSEGAKVTCSPHAAMIAVVTHIVMFGFAPVITNMFIDSCHIATHPISLRETYLHNTSDSSSGAVFVVLLC